MREWASVEWVLQSCKGNGEEWRKETTADGASLNTEVWTLVMYTQKVAGHRNCKGNGEGWKEEVRLRGGVLTQKIERGSKHRRSKP